MYLNTAPKKKKKKISLIHSDRKALKDEFCLLCLAWMEGNYASDMVTEWRGMVGTKGNGKSLSVGYVLSQSRFSQHTSVGVLWAFCVHIRTHTWITLCPGPDRETWNRNPRLIQSTRGQKNCSTFSCWELGTCRGKRKQDFWNINIECVYLHTGKAACLF